MSLYGSSTSWRLARALPSFRILQLRLAPRCSTTVRLSGPWSVNRPADTVKTKHCLVIDHIGLINKSSISLTGVFRFYPENKALSSLFKLRLLESCDNNHANYIYACILTGSMEQSLVWNDTIWLLLILGSASCWRGDGTGREGVMEFDLLQIIFFKM